MDIKTSKDAKVKNDDAVSVSESKSENKSESKSADEFSEKNLNSTSSSYSGAGFDDRDILLSHSDPELEDNAGVVARTAFDATNAINDTVKRAASAHHKEKHNLGELVQEKTIDAVIDLTAEFTKDIVKDAAKHMLEHGPLGWSAASVGAAGAAGGRPAAAASRARPPPPPAAAGCGAGRGPRTAAFEQAVGG